MKSCFGGGVGCLGSSPVSPNHLRKSLKWRLKAPLRWCRQEGLAGRAGRSSSLEIRPNRAIFSLRETCPETRKAKGGKTDIRASSGVSHDIRFPRSEHLLLLHSTAVAISLRHVRIPSPKCFCFEVNLDCNTQPHHM